MVAKLTDHELQLLESACKTFGCVNVTTPGYHYCVSCLCGTGEPLPENLRRIKRKRDKKLQKSEGKTK